MGFIFLVSFGKCFIRGFFGWGTWSQSRNLTSRGLQGNRNTLLACLLAKNMSLSWPQICKTTLLFARGARTRIGVWEWTIMGQNIAVDNSGVDVETRFVMVSIFIFDGVSLHDIKDVTHVLPLSSFWFWSKTNRWKPTKWKACSTCLFFFARLQLLRVQLHCFYGCALVIVVSAFGPPRQTRRKNTN